MYSCSVCSLLQVLSTCMKYASRSISTCRWGHQTGRQHETIKWGWQQHIGPDPVHNDCSHQASVFVLDGTNQALALRPAERQGAHLIDVIIVAVAVVAVRDASAARRGGPGHAALLGRAPCCNGIHTDVRKKMSENSGVAHSDHEA